MENVEFDYSTLFDFAATLPIIQAEPIKEKLTGSSDAVRRLKLEKQLFGKKKKDFYACRYEKALITIAEKDNGEF